MPGWLIREFMITFPSPSMVYNMCRWNSVVRCPKYRSAFSAYSRWLHRIYYFNFSA